MAIPPPWWRPSRREPGKRDMRSTSFRSVKCTLPAVWPVNTAIRRGLATSGSVCSGAIFEYQNSFLNDLHLEDMGIFSAYDRQNKSPEKLEELREFGRSL